MRYGLMDGKTYAQQEVAQKLGVSRSYISRIEKRRSNVCASLLKPENDRTIYKKMAKGRVLRENT